MTDGISEMYRGQKRYEEWDAPRCIVCMQKFDKKELPAHMLDHSVADLTEWATKISIQFWEREDDCK